MPDLTGYGTVTSLHSALTLDADLLEQVENFVRDQWSMPAEVMREEFEAIVAKWAGADNVAVGSRGAHIDAQHMEVVEAFYGSNFELVQGGIVVATDPNATNAVVVESAYQKLIDEMLLRFAIQVPIASILVDGVDSAPEFGAGGLHPLLNLEFDSAADVVNGDLGMVAVGVGKAAPAGVAEAFDYFDRALTVIKGAEWTLFGGNSANYATMVVAGATIGGGVLAGGYIEGRLAGLSLIEGTALGEQLSGTSNSEMFWSAAGNDTMSGGSGSDRYFYTVGDGDDRIVEGYSWNDVDKLVFGPGLSSTDVLVSGVNSAGHVQLSFTGSAGIILLENQFYSGTAAGHGIELIEFADNVTWTKTDLWNAYVEQAQTAGNDTIYGIAGSTTFTVASLEGADRIIEGYSWNDVDKLVFGPGLCTHPVRTAAARL